MADVVPNLGYSDVSNEIVDNDSTEESEFMENFNTAINKAKELYHLECETLAENSLENLNKEQLSAFLMVNYFDGGVKDYSQCRETGKFLDFSMKAALQLLFKGDTTKYDDNGNPSENGRTMDDIIKSRGGMDLDSDTVLVKILQKKVGAHPDGQPGPQTIALVISALGGDISSIYDGVNTLARSEKYRIKNIAEYTIGDVNYKYDKNQFTIGMEGDKIKITFGSEIKEVDTSSNPPECDGFVFSNGWIKRSSGSASVENGAVVKVEAIAESEGIFMNGDKELVDSKGYSLNNMKTNFVAGLIDTKETASREGSGRWGLNGTHSECIGYMKRGKFSYDGNIVKYVNLPLQFEIKPTTDENGNTYYTIYDKMPNRNQGYSYLNELKFFSLSEAMNTVKLIEYIKRRFEGVETGADTGNSEYNNGTDNDSPFFIGNFGLYFSTDHGFLQDDEDIISRENLKRVSGVLNGNAKLVPFAKYLIDTVNYDEER